MKASWTMRKRETGKLWWEDGPTGQYVEGADFGVNFDANFDVNFGLNFETNFEANFEVNFEVNFVS